MKKYFNLKKVNFIRLVPFMLSLVVLLLTVGFSAFSNNMLVSDISAVVRLKRMLE